MRREDVEMLRWESLYYPALSSAGLATSCNRLVEKPKLALQGSVIRRAEEWIICPPFRKRRDIEGFSELPDKRRLAGANVAGHHDEWGSQTNHGSSTSGECARDNPSGP
jgi:hypothetical protein